MTRKCQELRASNDDREDRDLQLDGGGISDRPVVIAVYPTAQAWQPGPEGFGDDDDDESLGGFEAVFVPPAIIHENRHYRYL